MPRTPNETIPTQFRLAADTLRQLDQIAAHLTTTHPERRPATRTDAVRFATIEAAKKISKKSAK